MEWICTIVHIRAIKSATRAADDLSISSFGTEFCKDRTCFARSLLVVFLIATLALHKLSGTFDNRYFKTFSKSICLSSFSGMLNSSAKISLFSSTNFLAFCQDVSFAMLLNPNTRLMRVCV